MRREIANSNERRRMQSINNGFQSLRSLLPHHEGEKLSKVSDCVIITFPKRLSPEESEYKEITVCQGLVSLVKSESDRLQGINTFVLVQITVVLILIRITSNLHNLCYRNTFFPLNYSLTVNITGTISLSYQYRKTILLLAQLLNLAVSGHAHATHTPHTANDNINIK